LQLPQKKQNKKTILSINLASKLQKHASLITGASNLEGEIYPNLKKPLYYYYWQAFKVFKMVFDTKLKTFRGNR